MEDALSGASRTLLRGEAGAGKTTLLYWLAITAARHGFTGPLSEWNGSVPFLVKLRDHADRTLPEGDELLRTPSNPVSGQPVPEGWVHRQMAAGQALLLVDGVDELTERQRPRVRAWLRKLLLNYPDIRVVVTSRPAAAPTRWLAAEGFRSVALEPMSPSDVQKFVTRWHQALIASHRDTDTLPCRPKDVPRHERTLLAQLRSRRDLQQLARNPLMCAMLCALNLDRGANLPRERARLYDAALEMLLERRDQERGIAGASELGLSGEEKRALLRALAWWLNENNRIEMSREQALLLLQQRIQAMPRVDADPETVLTHLLERSGVIRRPAADRIDFVHRTFQEFLAAREAVDRNSIDLLVSRAHSDMWWETVLMACAQASHHQRGALLTGLLNRAERSRARVRRQLQLLATACLETAVEAPPEVIRRVEETVRALLPPRGIRESRSLATVGGPLLPHLPKSLADLSPAQAAATVRTVTLINGPEAIPVLARYAPDPRSEVQQEINNSWQYFDAAEYATGVLRHAPLTEMLRIRRQTELDQLPLLTHARAVDVWDSTGVDDLTFATQLPRLESLWASLNGTCDLEVLRGRALRKLSLLAEGFESLEALSGLDRVEWLTLLPREAPLPDLRFLNGLERLSRLYLGPVASSDLFTPLAGCGQLHRLGLDGSGCLPDTRILTGLTGVRTLRLARFDAQDTIGPILSCFPELTTLLLFQCTGLRDLAPLAHLRQLRRVDLPRSPAVDLSPLAELPQLRTLSLVNTEGEYDLSPLAGRNLEIFLSSNQVVHGLDKLGPRSRIRRLN